MGDTRGNRGNLWDSPGYERGHVCRYKPRRRAYASGQASQLSANHVLQHLLVQRQISDQLPQLAVLVLELLQPPHLGRQQPVILLLPIEIRRLADPRLAADIGGRPSSFPNLMLKLL